MLNNFRFVSVPTNACVAKAARSNLKLSPILFHGTPITLIRSSLRTLDFVKEGLVSEGG